MNVLTCVYCGHEYPAGTPASGSEVEALTNHIKECQKHPMKKLAEQNKRLYDALVVISETEDATLQELIDTKKVFEAMVILKQDDGAKRAIKVYDALIEIKKESDGLSRTLEAFEKIIEDIPHPV